MALMTWGPALQIGYGDIDVQHKRLVDLINALDDGVRSGHSRDVLADVLTELARYTQLHFAFEEKLMELYGLSDTEEHRAEHARLTADVMSFKRQFDDGEVDLSADLLHYLRDWLNFHILQTDRALAQALRANGAVSAA